MARDEKPEFGQAYTRKHAKARDTLGKAVVKEYEAVLDDPEKFLQHPKQGRKAPVDRLVNSKFEDAPEGPISGDDIAKMRNSRIEFYPGRSKHDDPEGYSTLYRNHDDMFEGSGQFSVKPNMVAPPNRAHDESRRPDMGMSGPEQRARYA
jgi:hypothetical protein